METASAISLLEDGDSKPPAMETASALSLLEDCDSKPAAMETASALSLRENGDSKVSAISNKKSLEEEATDGIFLLNSTRDDAFAIINDHAKIEDNPTAEGKEIGYEKNHIASLDDTQVRRESPPPLHEDEFSVGSLDSKDVAAVSATTLFPPDTEHDCEADVGNDENLSADEVNEQDIDGLPPATEVWNDGIRPYPWLTSPIVPDDLPKGRGISRYRTFVSENDVENFTNKWRTEEHMNKQPVPRNDVEEMNRYVEGRFVKSGWPTTTAFNKAVEKKRATMKSALDRSKTIAKKDEMRKKYTKELAHMKKERKKFKRAFELEWTFGNAANVKGLRYNPMDDNFEARLVYFEKNELGEVQQKEETIPLSKEWIRDVKYAEGVIQHVINLGNTGDGFVAVPPGETILIHAKKVRKLRYVPPHTQWVADRHHKRTRQNPGQKMVQVAAPGYWEVLFHGETKPMITDEQFVSQFKQRFLDEVKHLRGGFVNIPVGDFKVSHLDEHPNLRVPDAPRVLFVQSEGEDLCVSKSLASALDAIGFVSEAASINQYGENHLRGGIVDAIKRVGQYAKSQLPSWVTRKVMKRPHMCDWTLLQEEMKDYIVLGVLGELDGNGSHAVTIHGGFVYDANEVVAIPLCKEALDYCCSTSTVKNEFMCFRKMTLFYYDGSDLKKKAQMILRTRSKRKRDGDENGGKKIVRTRYFFL